MRDNTVQNDVVSVARANEILKVIMSYAQLDYDSKIKIEGDGDVLDAIGSGVNMLGEELKMSTVSLKEKEELIKEVHHRVKNNLQIIISLINLQCELVTDPVNKASLSAFKNRIKSMALVHEMLYSSDNFISINLNSYVLSLIQHLKFSGEGNGSNIDFKINIDEHLNFEMAKMTPLGLILNEILSNSMKHAFGDKMGQISITATSNKSKSTIQIADNGVGLMHDFDIKHHANLGMQLMQILSEQIDAKLLFKNQNGLQIELEL